MSELPRTPLAVSLLESTYRVMATHQRPESASPDPRIRRRRVLQSLLGTGAAVIAAPVERGFGRTAHPSVIDPHSHIWTRDLKRFPLAAGSTLKDLDPPSFTAAELLQVMQKHDVGRAVLIQHHIYHGYDNSYL